MTVAVSVLVVLLLLYLLSMRGRIGHKGFAALQDWAYAHRGLHGAGAPENSMEAFRRAKDAGYGVELDVHLLSDGNLAVIHDSLLIRTTGQEGRVEDLTSEQLSLFKLEGTDCVIPTFEEVLELFAGCAPLIVELKVVDNYRQLCRRVCDMLDDYNGVYCVESFDPRCVRWFRKNRPDIIRGQLAENYFKSDGSKLPWVLKLLLSNNMLNFLTRPDFVAYRYSDRRDLSNLLCRKLWRMKSVYWTLKNQSEFDDTVRQHALPIFEDFCP